MKLNRFEKNFISTEEILKLIDKSIELKKSFSLARFGIGEMTYIMSNKYPILLHHFQRFHSYAGITSSPNVIRKDLIDALKTADLVALIPSWRLEFWANKTMQALEELNFFPTKVCCPWIMHDLVVQERFWPWIKDKDIVIVGRRSEEAVHLFNKQGVNVIGSFQLEGFKDLERVQDQLTNLAGWDVALLSAGIPATILAPRVTKTINKVAIDFGHALDMIIDGKNYDHLKLVQLYNESYFHNILSESINDIDKKHSQS